MTFAATVDQHYVTRFRDTAMLVTQQTRSKLRAFVNELPCEGEATLAQNFFAKSRAVKRQGRTRSNVETPIERSRRWHVIPDYQETGEYLDTEDKFRQSTDARSNLMMAHGHSIRRAIDDIILGVTELAGGGFEVDGGGILGSVAEGKSPGTSSVALPASQTLAVANSGLTLDKLMAMRQAVALADFDMDAANPVCAISPVQMNDLLSIAQQAGTGVNLTGEAVIREGRVARLMGIDFIETNRLPVDANGDRLCPMWMPPNIQLGVWSDYEARAWNDTHADNLPYINVRTRMDCVRLEDKGVVVAACKET